MSCFLLREVVQQGGGNIINKGRITVRRSAAIGDAVAASCVADKLVEAGYECEFQAHAAVHPVLRYQPSIANIQVPGGYAHVNLDGAYETDVHRRHLHFADAFINKANQQLAPYGMSLGKALNCRPRLVLPESLLSLGLAKFTDYPRPWVHVVPSSYYYKTRMVPDYVWQAAAPHIKGTKFWLGMGPAPEGIVDLKCRTLQNLMAWLSCSDLLITVDTGPLHIGAALRVKVLALGQSSSPDLHLSDQNDYQTIWPDGLDCLNCQENLCPKDPHMPPCQNFDPVKIAEFANRMSSSAKVSALIPTFFPDADKLERCLKAVSPQVDEVVLCSAADARIPNFTAPGNVRSVVSPKTKLGFGKNVNFGMRHTTGDWVLLLNDDCYLEPGCVEQLKTLCAPDVGMIAHLLRFPDGRIYFAGRKRLPGQRGFPHVNYLDHIPNISEVTEMEAVSATSVLVNRKAFYRAGGFDERFVMYAEDDDISLRIRQTGYRLLYHPTALGIHEGSVTSKKVGDMRHWIMESGKLMDQLWGWYWDKNKNRIPGVFK